MCMSSKKVNHSDMLRQYNGYWELLVLESDRMIWYNQIAVQVRIKGGKETKEVNNSSSLIICSHKFRYFYFSKHSLFICKNYARLLSYYLCVHPHLLNTV